MYKKRIRQITGALIRTLCSKQAEATLSLSREEAAELLSRQNYTARLQTLLSAGQRLSCAQVLDSCRDTLDALSPSPEEGWLSYTYRYACANLFPGQDNLSLRREHGAGALFFLALLQALFDDERRSFPTEPLLDIALLDDVEDSPHADLYHRFTACWRREFVYETMRLGMEATPFRALEHIAGVNFVAMSVARDLKRAGVPVDLALVSGAAVGHDIGKFGCRPGERVPYLHYYYTDQWFRRRRLDAIGHIAANHSVWDLELENLSVESLILIYADFRSKQERGPNGEEICHIFPLKESFDVILNKLDNVDDKKRQRYTFVYAKLHDFEQYMISLGVDVSLSGKLLPPQPHKDIALMDSQEVVTALKHSGVEHNLSLMHRLSNQRSFAAILEEARGETVWNKQRAYLNIFATYSIYLNTAQKEMMLSFLYENLMHRDGDIRRQAAALMGDILANFHAGYVKEVPAHHVPNPRDVTDLKLTEVYISKILYPDHKLIQMHKRWLNYTLKMVMSSLLTRCDPKRQGVFMALFLRFFSHGEKMDDTTAFTLLDAGAQIPLDCCTIPQLRHLLGFTQGLSQRPAVTVRATALELLGILAEWAEIREEALETIQAMPLGDSRSLTLQRQRILAKWQGGRDDDIVAALEDEDISDIFLENLKAATPWIIKKGNIRILTAYAKVDYGYHLLHIATHLSNLLMVSEQVTIRRTAGAALLAIAPLLSNDQRNEVAVELTRGLQTGQQEFSKYIPTYLGQFCLFLPPSQLEESLIELQDALCSANSAIVGAALTTAGVLYENYDAYRERFPEPDEVYRDRRERLLGMLLKGLAGFRSEVRQEALQVLGDCVFGSSVLSDHEKRRAFILSCKKLLFLMNEASGGDLTFFYRAATLSHIYRFITTQELTRGGFQFNERTKIAFFPGTFDPFTLSHKGIVRAIRDLGFEVMLAIDEFSWSKKTQPHRIRRRLASISVADEFHVHIFPENFPVNIANPANLRQLRQAFPGKEVYIVVGSDVVDNASSYRSTPTPDSIHTFPHVIFRRESSDGRESGGYRTITGEVVELSLPPHLEDISSTRIRDAIDANRDISNLIDPVAQEYIYRHNLYLREPMNKPVLQAEDLSFHYRIKPGESDFQALLSGPLAGREQGAEICRQIRVLGDTVITLRQEKTGLIQGFVSLHCLDSHELYSRLRDTRLSDFVRQNAGGKALVISGIYAPKSSERQDICQYLLTEAIAYALRQEYTYAFFCPLVDSCPSHLRELLTLQGFVPSPAFPGARELLVVNMRKPIVLTRNMDTVIKAPLADNPRVQAALSAAHRKLQKTLTTLYPGHLVLSTSATLLHRRLVSRITERNQVPSVPTTPRVLGKCICVPFGKILRGAAVPNTVTKTLHTDKVYTSDLSSSSVEAYPGYSPLEYQVKTIKAFNRPAILVDDMLNDGKRVRRVIPLMEREKAPIDEVLVGYLTGMGRDIMQEMGYTVDCVYYLPNLRMRFVESTLYPFIGGDTIQRSEPMAGGLLPSVNRIFPYAAPEYSEDCADGSTYRLSTCCLENARDILLTLEAEYRALYARNLTLSRLSEAIILPLCPDKGGCMNYDPNRSASTYLENDLMMLRRMRSRVRIVIGAEEE